MKTIHDKETPQMEKEDDITKRPVTIRDVYDLCEKLGVTVGDFQSHYGFDALRKKKDMVITKRRVAYIVRLLNKYPELSPFNKKLSFEEIYSFIEQNVEISYLTTKTIASLLGMELTTYQQMKCGIQSPTRGIIANFETIKPILIERGTAGAIELASLSDLTGKEERQKDAGKSTKKKKGNKEKQSA